MKSKISLIVPTVIFILLAAFPALAAIVPSCAPSCTVCDLLKLVQNIITFIIQVSIPLATAMILGGGIVILTAADSQKRLDLGKTILTNALVGLAIILGTWLVINSIIVTLVPSDKPWRPWNQINCQ